MFLRIPDFPFCPSSTSIPQTSATYLTRVSDLCVFRPSQIKTQLLSGAVSTVCFTAPQKSASFLVSFKYGGNIFPVATSKRPIRLVVPWRIYSNSIFASCPGSGSLSGYLCSNAWTPVISSVETTQVSSFIRSVLL